MSSVYKPEYPALISRLTYANVTATNIQLAKILEVSPSAIVLWMEKYEDFRLAVEGLRARANSKVEEALYRKATGYMKKVRKVTKDGDVVETEEEVPADNGAIIFWLKNRARDDWRDTMNSEISGPSGAPLPMINITLNTVKGQETIVPAVDMTKARGGSIDYHKRKQKLLAETRQQTFKPTFSKPQEPLQAAPASDLSPDPTSTPSSVAAPTSEDAEFEDYDEADYK